MKKTKKPEITKKDFDIATQSDHWTAETCLIATAVKRVTGLRRYVDILSETIHNNERYFFSDKARRAMRWP